MEKRILVGVLVVGVLAAVAYHWKFSAGKTEKVERTKERKRKSLKKEEKEQVAENTLNVESPQSTQNTQSLSLEEKQALAQEAKSIGNKLYAQKRFEDAIEMYSRAIDFNPTSVFYSNRAACYAHLQDYERVVDDCNHAIELDRKYIKALHRRAQAYENLNRHSDALNDYTVICVLEAFQNEASMAAPDRVLKAIAAEKTKEILKDKKFKMPSETFITAYMDSFRTTPTDLEIVRLVESDAESTLLLKQAFEHVSKREWEQANELCNKAIELDKFDSSSSEAIAFNLRGTFNFLMGNVDQAILDIEKTLELDNENVNAVIKRATLFMERGEVEKTMQQFERAEALAPNHPDLFYHRGQVRFLTGDFQGAVDDYSKSVASEKPGEQSVYVHIQMGVAKYKLGDIGGSEKKFKEAKRLFPDSAEVFNYHGEILMDKQVWQEALKSFDKAIEMDATCPLPYINKAILHLQWKRDAAEAESECRKALQADPLCDIAYTQLAQLLCHQGKIDEAMSVYDKAVDVTRTEAEVLNIISCREAAQAQRYVSLNYPDAMANIGR